ncbi:hypothetical protein TNCV_222942 [Trichonephila clavipes]|nr:hypothetical protein TNCV_222942 [Trichonephila clavipes]
MLTAGVVLLHENARPHTARRTADVFTDFGWELLDHPPYSPDLATAIFTFSCISRNYCPQVSVLATTKSRRCLSHAGSIHRRQSSTTEGYKS